MEVRTIVWTKLKTEHITPKPCFSFSSMMKEKSEQHDMMAVAIVKAKPTPKRVPAWLTSNRD